MLATALRSPSFPVSFLAQNGNTGVVPPRPNGNTGIVTPTPTTNGNTGIVPNRGLGNAVVETQVRGRVASFLRAGVDFAKPATAPVDPERFPSCNVNPMGEMGVSFRAFNVGGQLMLCRQSICPGAKPTWFDLGRMPTGIVSA